MPAFEEKGLPGRKRTILVVEDNDVNREMLASLLEDDYRIILAKDGKEGIEQMRQCCEDISLIMLDIYMPEVDGFDVLRFRQTDERFSNIPVIVATTSDSVQDELLSLELGANDFVTKPYNAEIILHRIRNTIHMRESASVVNQLRWDATTGLYRRDFFCRRVDNLLAAYPDRRFDMVCCDVRNFKVLNERYGRQTCDRLLHDLAEKLASTIPDVETCGRVGGDSFGFFIRHQEYDWTSILKPAIQSLEYAHLYVRFGIILDVDHGLSATQLCDRTTIAIDRLRDSVGVGIAWYDDTLRQRIHMENNLIEDMESSLSNHQFVVYYQPKHDVVHGKVSGAEALVRWLHPDMGLVRPETFIPAFERSGRITRLDRYVCEEACKELARLSSMGLPVVPISVNVSPIDFDDHDIVDHITRLADSYGVNHALLHIELTETAYSEDPDTVVHALAELRARGFKIELDDFGTGYASLALLSMLPLDIIKIDAGMVRRASRKGDFRIIQSAIQIAQLLGLETVIEGVETEETLKRLRKMGCDMIQGFYYSWPLRQGDFEQYLRDNA